ncbi:MAG: NAD-dependent epimerase/dehydratase family protein, partial [Helicobacter sp.]|nr:NAD-dependent epimerase/dehydratase family protein [Helicobacter sp.]
FSDSRAQSLVANICEPFELPSTTKLDAIVHLASPASPAAFAASPIATIMLNVHATQNLLELASAHHANFIFASSSEIYGESAKILAETDMGTLDSMDWRSCYNESKRVGETLTQSFAKQKGTQSVVLRIPRTFGATFGAHDNRALSSFLRDCAHDRDIVLKSDGQQMYSFLYVGDCARSLAFALAKLPANNAYNVANEAMSLRDFALHVARLNPKICLRIEKAEQIGITKTQHSILDTTKIKNCGFFPKFSLQEGLEWTFRILKEQKERE